MNDQIRAEFEGLAGLYPTFRHSTDKQHQFLKSLIAERDLSVDLHNHVAAARHAVMNGRLSAKEASALIDLLKEAPKKSQAVLEIEAGVYLLADGRLVRVYLGQNNGRMLAKQIDNAHGSVVYTYLGQADRVIKANSTRLSLQEVGDLGVAWGHCLLCGRLLTDPESVDRGVGPVCAAKY